MKTEQIIRSLAGSPPQRRSANVGPINVEARTVELAFSSETEKVERWFGIEILGHGPGEVNLERLANGAPVLWNHDFNDQRGVVVSARIDADGVGRAVVRFSKSPDGERLFQDIVDGIITKVSVGYSTEGLQLVEERDGVSVYRITAWTPFEISMVSVPADDDVGVGRSLSVANQRGAHFTENRNERSEKMSAAQPIADLLERGRAAQGVKLFYNEDGSVRGTYKQPTSATATHSLRELQVPSLIFGPLHIAKTVLPTGTEAGRTVTMGKGIAAASLCHAMGARIIPVPAADDTTIINGVPVYKQRDIRFDLISPAAFSRVVDGESLALSSLATARQCVDLDTMPTFGVRVSLSRAERRQYENGQLAETALASITMGIARTVDYVLLNTILWNNPTAFTLAKAAAAGLRFDELRAIGGTNAAALAVAATGGLVALPSGSIFTGGIPAELTDCITQTLVGAWSNCAVAIHEDIRLIANRANRGDDLELICFVSLEALTPRENVFWTMAA